MIKVTCQIDNYDEPRKLDVRVHSHWCDKSKVVIEYDDKRFTVMADDMIRAIENCKNTKPY